MFVKHEADTKSTYLTRIKGGGAVITKLDKGIVIGIWHKDEAMSKGGNQNQFDCAMQVEAMGKFLRDHNY